MKKLRFLIHIATAILILIAITGIVIQILSPKSLADTAFDLITLSISVASVTLVITTQISSYQDRQRFLKMVNKLGEIDAELDAELKADKKIDKVLHEELKTDKEIDKILHKKLDETLKMNERILAELAKNSKK